mmetsp:Transcript_45110/g.139600  ORF Transcript_45110/g.139600 Transcript_45110/m.139600 type:complete len:444 (-) Transcript_45110:33-1364(-)
MPALRFKAVELRYAKAHVLRDWCKDFGLSRKGTKAELVKRLEAFFAVGKKNKATATASPSASAVADGTPRRPGRPRKEATATALPEPTVTRASKAVQGPRRPPGRPRKEHRASQPPLEEVDPLAPSQCQQPQSRRAGWKPGALRLEAVATAAPEEEPLEQPPPEDEEPAAPSAWKRPRLWEAATRMLACEPAANPPEADGDEGACEEDTVLVQQPSKAVAAVSVEPPDAEMEVAEQPPAAQLAATEPEVVQPQEHTDLCQQPLTAVTTISAEPPDVLTEVAEHPAKQPAAHLEATEPEAIQPQDLPAAEVPAPAEPLPVEAAEPLTVSSPVQSRRAATPQPQPKTPLVLTWTARGIMAMQALAEPREPPPPSPGASGAAVAGASPAQKVAASSPASSPGAASHVALTPLPLAKEVETPALVITWTSRGFSREGWQCPAAHYGG